MTKFIAWGQRVLPRAKAQPPGNSLSIIDKAYECGYDGIELDLRLTRDGGLVLMHDDGIAKTTDADGKVSTMTTAELTQIQLKDDWGGPPEFIPTFAQALARNGDRGYLMVDLRKLDRPTEIALAQAVDEAKFDPALFLFLAYNRATGLRYQELFPSSLVMLKAPINLKPPELTADFVAEAEGLGAVIVPTVAFPETTAQFRERTLETGQKLGIFLLHQGIATLRSIVKGGVDFVTAMNPADFDAIREEFGLKRGYEK